jgi:hypothetical protein
MLFAGNRSGIVKAKKSMVGMLGMTVVFLALVV